MPRRRDERPSRSFRKTRRYREAARELGSRVRHARRSQKLTLERAAEKTGLDFRHLQQIEAGTVNVTLATIIRIATGLETEPSWLMASETPFDSLGSRPAAGHAAPATLEARAPRLIQKAPTGALETSPSPRQSSRRRSPNANSQVGPETGAPSVEAGDVQRRAGRTIARLRSGHMTQAELAALVGVSLKYVQRVEAGTQNLTIASLVRFANVETITRKRGVSITRDRKSSWAGSRPSEWAQGDVRLVSVGRTALS